MLVCVSTSARMDQADPDFKLFVLSLPKLLTQRCPTTLLGQNLIITFLFASIILMKSKSSTKRVFASL